MEKASHSKDRAVVTEISGRGAYFIRSSVHHKIVFLLSLNGDEKAIFLPAANRLSRRRFERKIRARGQDQSRLAG
jgi:hypothetical protein